MVEDVWGSCGPATLRIAKGNSIESKSREDDSLRKITLFACLLLLSLGANAKSSFDYPGCPDPTTCGDPAAPFAVARSLGSAAAFELISNDTALKASAVVCPNAEHFGGKEPAAPQPLPPPAGTPIIRDLRLQAFTGTAAGEGRGATPQPRPADPPTVRDGKVGKDKSAAPQPDQNKPPVIRDGKTEGGKSATPAPRPPDTPTVRD